MGFSPYLGIRSGGGGGGAPKGWVHTLLVQFSPPGNKQLCTNPLGNPPPPMRPIPK